MSEQVPARRAKRPRGVILLVLLFYTAAALVVIAILATSEQSMPGDIGALVTLCLIALAWGLWKLFRWAWFATLIMFVISTFYILSSARFDGLAVTDVTVLVPLGFIAVSFVYLISPNVRRVYLNNGWFNEDPA